MTNELTPRQKQNLRRDIRGLHDRLNNPEKRAALDDRMVALCTEQMADMVRQLGEPLEDIIHKRINQKVRQTQSAAKNPLGLPPDELKRRRNRRDKQLRLVRTIQKEVDGGLDPRAAGRLQDAERKLHRLTEELGYDPEDHGGNQQRYVTKAEAFAEAERLRAEREADELEASLSKDQRYRLFKPIRDEQAWSNKAGAERDYLRRLGFPFSTIYLKGRWVSYLPRTIEIEIDPDLPIGEDDDGEPIYARVDVITAGERQHIYWSEQATPEQVGRRIRSRRGLSVMERTAAAWNLYHRRWIRAELRLLAAGRMTPEMMTLVEAHRPPPDLPANVLQEIARARGIRPNPRAAV